MAGDMQEALSKLTEAQSAFERTTTVQNQVHQPWSTDLIQFLSLSVLGFCCLALLLATVLLWRSASPAQQILRIFGVISILGLSSLLLIVGYDNDQLTPIVGLFGAIAGYLLGKDAKGDDTK
ncbi:hypothetical protein [Oceanicoccus sp. KOV_DT_Chl]|uniref:hypothetical protein n=1 Tax=Oceanicoccus sp. KOV_DT_Chl TaxID=1904639 RepID=UPI000C7BC32C|nr:hypothetical protein [Oceanicoccus sp. KOV_DT_Chl]